MAKEVKVRTTGISVLVRSTEDGRFVVSEDRGRFAATKSYAPDYKELPKAIKRCMEEAVAQREIDEKESDAIEKKQDDFRDAEKAAYLEGLKAGKQKLARR